MRMRAAQMIGAGLPLIAALAALAVPWGPAAAGGGRSEPAARTLENGSVFIYQQDPASAVSVLGIVIGGGRAAEPEGKDGLANLVTRLALEIPLKPETATLMQTGFGNQDGDPLFRNAAARNYRPIPASPCRDAGVWDRVRP